MIESGLVISTSFLIFIKLFLLSRYLVTNYYDIKRYYLFLKNEYIVRKWQILIKLPLVIVIGFCTYYHLGIIALIILNFLWGIDLYLSPRLKTRFTRRSLFLFVILFFVTLSFPLIGLLINPTLFILLTLVPGLLYFLVPLLALEISLPLESLIRHKYYKKARLKLALNPHLIVIGITGSYGKTTFKECLYHNLMLNYRVLKSPGNVNTVIGLLKFINKSLSPYDDILILEMGVDRIGGMKKFSKLTKLDMAVITEVGEQHLATFKNFYNILKEKTSIQYLLKSGGVLYFNKSNPYLKDYSFSVSSVGYEVPTNLSLVSRDNQNYLLYNGIEYESSISNNFNLVAGVGSYLMAKSLHVEVSLLNYSFNHLPSSERRKKIVTINNVTLIDDSYNINFSGFQEAVSLIKRYAPPYTLITRGLVELGKGGGIRSLEFAALCGIFNRIYLIGDVNPSLIMGLEFLKESHDVKVIKLKATLPLNINSLIPNSGTVLITALGNSETIL